MEKEKLLISFSGGETSGYMLWWILQNWSDKYEILVVFANTGREHEKTFQFVNDCSYWFNVHITWVEAVPNSIKGWSVTHRIVRYETASRNGEPFEVFIQKIGIPCTSNPYCSSILKREVIKSYCKSMGWRKYYTAIGIRNDEIDRITPNYIKKRILYPLITDNPTNKKQVKEFWSKQPFKLEVPQGLGNCDNCYKMSYKHLIYNAINYPESFNWWRSMVDKYGYTKHRKGQENMIPPFNFYRGNKSVDDIFEMEKLSKRQLEMFENYDVPNGCSESCEVF